MVENLEKQIKTALRVEVPADARQRVRARVMKGTERILPQPPAGRRRWRLLRPLPLAAALVLLLFAGTALAAAGAQPDSWLYPLKQKAEDARVMLAFQGLDKAKVEVGRAHKRLDEIESLAASGKPEYVPELLARYNGHLGRAEEFLSEAAGRGEQVDEVEYLIAAARIRHDDLLRGMLAQLPANVADEVRRELGECPGCPVFNGGATVESMPGGSGEGAGGMNEGMPGGAGGEMMPAPGSDEAMPAPGSGGYMEPGGSMDSRGSGGGAMDGGGMDSGTNGSDSGMPSGTDSSMPGGTGSGGPNGGGMSEPAAPADMGSGSASRGPEGN